MPTTRTFTREYLLDELGLPDDVARDTVEIISDVIVDSGRWSNHHELTFRLSTMAPDEAWRVAYSVGATEAQEEGPWDNKRLVTATLVRQVERVVKVWEPAE